MKGSGLMHLKTALFSWLHPLQQCHTYQCALSIHFIKWERAQMHANICALYALLKGSYLFCKKVTCSFSVHSVQDILCYYIPNVKLK